MNATLKMSTNADSSPSRCPRATYRLQFNADFRFEQAAAILDYLHNLGVTHLYASPLTKSGLESTHGYDVCSYQEIDPKLGGTAGFADLSSRMKAAGLGLVLDIVPNHMRADVSNPWWMDVLEKGPYSRYALYFDIDWNSDLPNVYRKVLVPVLGDVYAALLESGQIKLLFSEGGLWVAYGPHRFPASLESYPELLKETLRFLLPNSPERAAIEGFLEEWGTGRDPLKSEPLKIEAGHLFSSSEPFRAALNQSLALLNGEPGNPGSFDRLDRILQHQHYRLSWWRIGPEQIDYRRFFDITGLVCINAQRPEVFEDSHNLVKTLIARGAVNGLRVDHPDGLWDPRQYFTRLSEFWPANQAKAACFIVAEKILSGNEHLPRSWPVSGTTGYDFLNHVNGIFIDTGNKEAITGIYKAFTGKKMNFGRLLFASRLKVLRQSFSGQFESLVESLLGVASRTRYGRDFTVKSLRAALSNFISAFPVYRTYVTEDTQEITLQERRAVERAYRESRLGMSSADSMVLDFLRQILLLQFPKDYDAEARWQARRFMMKLQQLTAPLAAKGQEDTACYIYNRLVSLNEVGGNPGKFGSLVEEFHRANEHRARRWPNTMLATATHDTKRGEDVRARINVLSEEPEQWALALARWKEENQGAKTVLNGNLVPYPNDEYLLYQTLVGTWTGRMADDPEVYRDRIVQYMLKAVREGKEYTSWTDQNETYEKALQEFIEKILSSHPDNQFLVDFDAFARSTSFFGYLNSLSQVLLKMLSPGVPDFYQGTELWDDSLVDPDNRRPVDYPSRISLLRDLESRFVNMPRSDFLKELLNDMPSGAVKMFTIWQTLQLRKVRSKIFTEGRYQPCSVLGPGASHICAFARIRLSEMIMAIAPRMVCKLTSGEERFPFGPEVWSDTFVSWPNAQIGRRFRETFTGRELITTEQTAHGCAGFPVGGLLTEFPIALLSSAL